MTATIKLHHDAIRNDPQIAELLESAGRDLAREANSNTDAPAGFVAGPVEDGPSLMVGARGAAAVSVEFGTRVRRASRPLKRAADALGIEIGS